MMNYSLYLQSGGSMQAPMSDEQALAHKKEVDNQMAEAIKLNPASLDQAIQEYGEDAPSFIKHMIDVAAENQDEELLEILKPYAEKFNIMSFRCGGKVRAKIKKACSGKKMEKGGEAPIKKEAKGGKPCPCTLHKVGGKLIEVDCNGIPVAKQGTKIVYSQTPAMNTFGWLFTTNPSVASSYPNYKVKKAPTWKELFAAGQAKFGGLTKAEALQRQKEMLAAEGFNADLGRWGADGMWGNQSKSEWERYQQWKADQELAAMKAQNANLQRVESTTALNPNRITVDNATASAPLAVTKNGNIVRTSSLTPGQALSQLNTPAWEEYTRRLRQGILSSKNGGKMTYSDYLKCTQS